MFQQNKIVAGDCLKVLPQIQNKKFDLIFADPPYNIGYDYDRYQDVQDHEKYVNWTEQWMKLCAESLAESGSFWIIIGAEYAAEVRIIGRKLGLELRNWIIWHYSFGQNAVNKFSRSHAHIFYFVKDADNFTFHDEPIRTFSDRERIYKDKRAKLTGRMPFDVWTEFPRVCGSFAEKQDWHPCQIPESILARIIRVCSNPDDLIFDPFAGSGTTLAVAKKLSRDYFGIELSAKYVAGIEKRLSQILPLQDEISAGENWSDQQVQYLKNAYRDYAVPVATLERSPEMLHRFAVRFNWRIKHSLREPIEISGEQILKQLCLLRLAHKLPKIKVYFKEQQKKSSQILSEFL